MAKSLCCKTMQFGAFRCATSERDLRVSWLARPLKRQPISPVLASASDADIALADAASIPARDRDLSGNCGC